MNYYNNNKDNYTKNVINSLLMNINYNDIPLNQLTDEELNELNSFENIKSIIDNKRSIKNRIKIMRYDYRIKEILYKYYYKINDIIEIDSIIIYI